MQTSSQKWLKYNDPALTVRMTAVLLEHANSPRPTRAVTELRVLRPLWQRGLIRFNRPRRPTHSIATVRGREIMSVLLAKPVNARVEHRAEYEVVRDLASPRASL